MTGSPICSPASASLARVSSKPAGQDRRASPDRRADRASVADRNTAAGRSPADRDRAATAVTWAAYLLLFLLGLLEGLIGSFQYSQGPVPLLPIVFVVAIFATCALGARGMRSALGAVLPAIGWFLITLWLSNGTTSGSVIITDTAAGKWFLFGGSLAAAAGAVYGFARWSRASRERRDAASRRTR